MQLSLNNIFLTVLFSATAFAGPLYTVDIPATTKNATLLTRDQKIGEHSGLTISFWGNPTCEDSTMALWPDVTYNSQIYGLAAAYTLSRDLRENEVLDVSTGHNMDTSSFAMTEAITPKSGQYPGPGWAEGGWVVPSACDTYLASSSPGQAHLHPNGRKACYTAKKAFNCARLWMRS